MSQSWMFRSAIRSFARVAVLVLGLSLPCAAAQYILELKAASSLSGVLSTYGLMLVRSLEHPGGTVYLVSTLNPVTPQFFKQINGDSRVAEFESDSDIHSPEIPGVLPPVINTSVLASAIQNTSQMQYYGSQVRGSYAQQPAGTLIELPGALQKYATGSGIVAVIDTGIDPTHPAFKNVLVPGYDFTRALPGSGSELADLAQSTVAILDQSTVAILDSKKFGLLLNQSTVAILDQSTVAILDTLNVPSDFGHGTMVAGLIHLVAPTAGIMPLKAFRSDGSASLSDIVSAVYYAVDHQAKVINMSFSSPLASTSLAAAIQYATSHNVICIASGGNDGKRETVYPAAIPGVIGVGSTTALDKRSFFSNYGYPSVRMAAPGEALITTYPGNNYAGVWGTSFSAALTSGAVALLLQVKPHLHNSDVSDYLEHGHHLNIDGMGDSRLDVLSTLLAAILNN